MDNYDSQVPGFLQRISQLESSGGQNTNHKVITHGIQKGQKAIGQYGMLNNTIQEMLQRMHSEGTLPPELAQLEGAPQSQVRKAFQQNPQLEQQIAGYLAHHVLTRQGGNELAAAYSWNQGHNLPPDSITTNKLVNTPYTQRYEKLLQQAPTTTTAGSGPIQPVGPEASNPPQRFDINNLINNISSPESFQNDLNFINRPTEPMDLTNTEEIADSPDSDADQPPEDENQQDTTQNASMRDLRNAFQRYYQF